MSFNNNNNNIMIAIGSGDTSNNGKVQFYEYNNPNGISLRDDIISNSRNNFGYSVSMNSNGSRVAIGAPNKSGRVQVYQYRTVTNDEWVEKNIVKGDDETLKTDKANYNRSTNYNTTHTHTHTHTHTTTHTHTSF